MVTAEAAVLFYSVYIGFCLHRRFELDVADDFCFLRVGVGLSTDRRRRDRKWGIELVAGDWQFLSENQPIFSDTFLSAQKCLGFGWRFVCKQQWTIPLLRRPNDNSGYRRFKNGPYRFLGFQVLPETCSETNSAHLSHNINSTAQICFILGSVQCLRFVLRLRLFWLATKYGREARVAAKLSARAHAAK